LKALLRILPLLNPYRRQAILALAVILGLTGINLSVPLIISQVIDVGLRGNGGSLYLTLAALLLLVIGLARSGLDYIQRYLSEWLAAQVGYDLRNRLYDHIQNLSFSFHDHSQAGQLISRTIEDVRAVERFTGSGLIELIRLLLMVIGILTILIWLQPLLALIALLPMIPLVYVAVDFGIKIGQSFLKVDNSLGDVSVRLQENVSGAQVVRAFAREPYEVERFAGANQTYTQARINVVNMWGRAMPTTNLLVAIGEVLILWFGGQMVIAGQITIGEVVAFNGYLLLLAAPMQQLTWVINAAGEAVAGAQRAFEILDTPPDIASPAGAVSLPALSGAVEFRQVQFNYQGEAIQALKDINLIVAPNQMAALIGPTGSGKTSLISLIPRFYDVASGAVLVDGQDVRQVDLTSLRRQIGIVLQTSLLFSTSVAENIAYGRPEATRDEIIAAALNAQAHDFIMELPDGYDTVVGERGVTLSGGQRQRVAIARALLMDPRILILDDSTSSVDTETERRIQLALDRLMEGRTTFVIAHRLSTIRRADLILVMDGGRIVERGRHVELIQQDGLYRRYYELQLRSQERYLDEMATMQQPMDLKEDAQ
jgi:ATP-binding cassette subfamily B protein